jgi:hypothetical protein
MSDNARGPYTLIVRGQDGRPRLERFDEAGEYLARLARLRHRQSESLSIDDVAAFLDASGATDR